MEEYTIKQQNQLCRTIINKQGCKQLKKFIDNRGLSTIQCDKGDIKCTATLIDENNEIIEEAVGYNGGKSEENVKEKIDASSFSPILEKVKDTNSTPTTWSKYYCAEPNSLAEVLDKVYHGKPSIHSDLTLKMSEATLRRSGVRKDRCGFCKQWIPNDGECFIQSVPAPYESQTIDKAEAKSELERKETTLTPLESDLRYLVGSDDEEDSLDLAQEPKETKEDNIGLRFRTLPDFDFDFW